MLHVSSLPTTLWGEAIRHTVWLINRTLTKALDGKVLLEAATSSHPDLSQLQEWGCHVWVHDNCASKFEPCMCDGHWIGLDDASKGC